MIVVSNSSPLIAFAEIEQLELFPSVFSSVFIPPAVGTVGVLLAAKRHGLIHRVRPLVDLLVQKSFFVGPELYAEILRLAGEQDA